MDMEQALWNKVSTLTEAQAAGGSGRVEPGRVIVDDGSLDGKEVHPAMDGAFYKVTDEVLDLSKVKFVTGTVDGMEMTTTYFATDNTMTANYLYPIMNGEVHDMFIVVVETADREADSGEPVSAGTYILNTGAPWRIEFAETIHTIDPKFLPGGSGTVGEEVWGSIIAEGFMQSVTKDDGIATGTFHDVGGLTVSQLAEKCQQADGIEFDMQGYKCRATFATKLHDENGALVQTALSALVCFGSAVYKAEFLLMFLSSLRIMFKTETVTTL